MKELLVVMAVVGILLVLVGLITGKTIVYRDLDQVYVFAKHDSTGLCFFGEDLNGNGVMDGGTSGNVPCTPEVEKWIADHKVSK